MSGKHDIIFSPFPTFQSSNFCKCFKLQLKLTKFADEEISNLMNDIVMAVPPLYSTGVGVDF